MKGVIFQMAPTDTPVMSRIPLSATRVIRGLTPLEDRPCTVPGCDEPRYVSPNGTVASRCKPHHAAASREWRARHSQEPTVGTCAECGSTFELRTPWQRFCAPACRRRSKRSAGTREASCLRCGATFTTTRGDQTYCTALCGRRAGRARHKQRERRHRMVT